MLSDPIAELGGLERLPELLAAYTANAAEGWDNDSFSVHLVDLVESAPSTAINQLERLRDSFPELVEWLHEFWTPVGPDSPGKRLADFWHAALADDSSAETRTVLVRRQA